MISLLLTIAVSGAAQAPAGEDFVADGLFSVATPSGYAWSLAKEGETQGVAFRAYVCAREGSPTRIVVTVEGRVVATDEERSAAVKGHWNGMLEMLQNGGFTRPETQRPKLDPPLPDRVPYRLTADDPTGARRHVRCVTVFGRKNIYLIQSMAASVDEADALMPTLDSFRELP